MGASRLVEGAGKAKRPEPRFPSYKRGTVICGPCPPRTVVRSRGHACFASVKASWRGEQRPSTGTLSAASSCLKQKILTRDLLFSSHLVLTAERRETSLDEGVCTVVHVHVFGGAGGCSPHLFGPTSVPSTGWGLLSGWNSLPALKSQGEGNT